MRIFLVHNPEAGEQEIDGEALVAIFEAEGHRVAYRHAKEDRIEPGEAADSDLVVVAGGDGTVGGAVRTLHAVDRPFAIVPLGTANNIARCLGVMDSPRAVARGCADCRERRLDIGVAAGPWGRRIFLEGVGLGGLADLVAEGDAADMSYSEEKRFGREAPPRVLSAEEEHLWRVEVAGRRLPERLLLVEFLNTPLVGPNLPIGCGGWPDDGSLDIAYLPPEGRDAFVGWLKSDRRPPAPGLAILSGARVAFDWTGGALRIDDDFPDFPDVAARVELHVEPRRLRILVPDKVRET